MGAAPAQVHARCAGQVRQGRAVRGPRRDLRLSRAFYVDRLGWEAATYVPGEVLMIRVGELVMLSLWAEAGFEAEVGPLRRGSGLAPVTLAHNVRTPEDVDRVLAEAQAAGAEVSGAAHREWGGYTGYFADPDGYRWEIAHNPGPEGALVLP
ncbi:VOC family protein [Nocardioidaceae bacterium]|nr:VOC family protein [Nocardioidaceae bacterium]